MVVEQKQSLVDISIQHCGDVIAVFDLALTNDLSLTEELTAGDELLLTDPIEKQVVDFFANKNLIPATEELVTEQPQQGIGFWRIGIDFKVS